MCADRGSTRGLKLVLALGFGVVKQVLLRSRRLEGLRLGKPVKDDKERRGTRTAVTLGERYPVLGKCCLKVIRESRWSGETRGDNKTLRVGQLPTQKFVTR